MQRLYGLSSSTDIGEEAVHEDSTTSAWNSCSHQRLHDFHLSTGSSMTYRGVSDNGIDEDSMIAEFSKRYYHLADVVRETTNL